MDLERRAADKKLGGGRDGATVRMGIVLQMDTRGSSLV